MTTEYTGPERTAELADLRARLADAVHALHSRSARELNDGILETVHRFAGSTALRDDLTLVTIKRV